MFTVLCRTCSFKLYESREPVSAEFVYKYYGGRCPRCGRKLNKKPVRVEIK